MREIKFRGKTENGKWLYGNLLVPPPNCVPCYMWDEDKYQCIVSEKTIGQYTGLKDKNGKEIYEGDIVKENSGRVGYISFLQQEMGYVIVWRNSDSRLGHRHRGSGYDLDNTIKVIGNIHDNPELIKEEKK